MQRFEVQISTYTYLYVLTSHLDNDQPGTQLFIAFMATFYWVM